MSDVSDQLSDTSSDINWPLDHPIERQPDDRVVFENVADQYIKGADVTVFFTILHDIKINPDEDQIGILRVGYTNIKECVAYAPVQYNPSTTSGSARHGTATFLPSSLPVTDDEFYQFCYILNKTKNLGSSIPFQLNCTSDDVAMLSKASPESTKANSLITVADNDNDDFLVVHKKQSLIEDKLRQENRQLLDINRRLELQNDEFKTKMDLMDVKTKEHTQKVYNEMQTLIASHKTAIDELSSREQSESKLRKEFDACRTLCSQYQADSLKNAERCHTLENMNSKLADEFNQVRSHLTITSQLTKDQATQIIELERRLMQCDELSKTSSQIQASLEQQLRDLRLTSEKYQISTQAQLAAYAKQVAEKDEEINQLKVENNALKEEIQALTTINDEVLSSKAVNDEELEKQINELKEQHRVTIESAQKEIETLKNKVLEMNSLQQAYATLKISFTEIEKRCVKHQKSEIEVKRKLANSSDDIRKLEREIEDLTTRLSDGADEYKALFLKLRALEREVASKQRETSNPTTLVNGSIFTDEALESMLRDVHAPLQEKKEERNDQANSLTSIVASLNDAEGEIRNCPMCYLEFPKNMTIESKQEHVDQHFR